MPSIRKEVPILPSPRVTQVLSMFDVPPAERSVVEWDVALPLDARPWQVGLIVGPSGAGKSTIARSLFGDALIDGFAWPAERAIVDAFPPDLSIKAITGLLTAVGFGTTPAWLRPFHVLSTGEQFRVTVARALADARPLTVIDEFTSVVDRKVAQVASHAIQKAVRRTTQQLIAVSCHYDIVEWLQPDWIYQPHGGRFDWRAVQPHPPVVVDLHPVDRAAWSLFAPYHYLSRNLAAGAKCFGAFVDGACIGFCSYIHFPHPRRKNIKMGHRLVVLPDWQGLGIGGRMDDWMGQYLYAQGFTLHVVVVHPARQAYCARSPRWQLTRTGRLGDGQAPNASPSLAAHHTAFSSRRTSSTFVYVPPVGVPLGPVQGALP